MEKEKKLGLSLLVALGVGSMIGGGIFNSPTDLIGKANPQSVLIAWAVGGLGVAFLALVFQMLANRRPELTGGIFTYAKEGFGEFIGFNSAWGYWLSAWLGNVAFFILIFKTFNSLVGDMSPIISFILASALLWGIHYIQMSGIKSAGIINAVATVAKIIPLLMVVVFGLAIFKFGTFNVSNWKTVLAATGDSTTVFAQVKGAMGTILWCFIGIEAATVLSERAKSQKIVGTATIISLIVTLILYALVSTTAMGVISAKALAGSATPLADVLASTVIGSVGALIVKVGLIVSLVGCLISWIMLAAEIPYVAAKGGTMPKWFMKQNNNGATVNSLLLTDGLTQIFLLSLLLPALQTAYNSVFLISTTCILIPYLLSSLYAVKVSLADGLGLKDKVVSILACIYSLYVIYAVGIKYLGTAVILYAIGIFVYLKARKEKNEVVSLNEKIGMAAIMIGAILMIILLAIGKIQL
ncbi:basic amino acid/polyamine antiporter [Clostridium sp. FP2]|uniref:basic amino acid/polyamine antiporter n=1 Tax=Clostridium sp. FP2 TaxID=2724481 RepID=UPI0013E919C3|nr:basic amino acid/polyamine antiporter [Clostridium sp. FP2]MBZ9622110.1 basic amino acid/polyamine antiporter [Clostridium sp. FP2]